MKVYELRPGAATSIGSLPHDDASEAAEFALRVQPHLPAAPQLPHAHPAEGMLSQAASGGDTAGPSWGGLRAFLDKVADRTAPIKLQMTGPITAGLARMRREGEPAATAFANAARLAGEQARAIVALARARAPKVGLVAFLDEPGLTVWAGANAPLSGEAVVDLLSGTLASLGPDVVTGVHCCGPTDFKLVTAAGPDILSAPLDTGLADAAPTVASFLENGGWVAWGAAPTDRPIGASADGLWRRLVDLWCALTQQGCDPALLRQQSLVTPSCGLANYRVQQAEHVLELANVVAARVHSQAVASRLSVGA